ncbi:hypothetical protein D3C76_1378180 [compost metagenome]
MTTQFFNRSPTQSINRALTYIYPSTVGIATKMKRITFVRILPILFERLVLKSATHRAIPFNSFFVIPDKNAITRFILLIQLFFMHK